MKLGKRIVKQLEQLASQGPTLVDAVALSDRQGGYIVGVPADGHEPGATITLEAYDRYSVALRQLEVSFDHLATDASNKTDYLRHCAEQIARRLTYLEEPLALLELAAEDKLAQLRSQPPHQEDETLTYWEAFIWAEPQPHLKLARYCWTPGQAEREQVVYPATFTTIGRIAQDLALSLKG